MRDASARSRAGLTSDAAPGSEEIDTRVRVNLPHLRSLEGRARKLTLLPRQPVSRCLRRQAVTRRPRYLRSPQSDLTTIK